VKRKKRKSGGLVAENVSRKRKAQALQVLAGPLLQVLAGPLLQAQIQAAAQVALTAEAQAVVVQVAISK
jgi:hypothetical protein